MRQIRFSGEVRWATEVSCMILASTLREQRHDTDRRSLEHGADNLKRHRRARDKHHLREIRCISSFKSLSQSHYPQHHLGHLKHNMCHRPGV